LKSWVYSNILPKMKVIITAIHFLKEANRLSVMHQIDKKEWKEICQRTESSLTHPSASAFGGGSKASSISVWTL
jgi:hypothetical protein